MTEDDLIKKFDEHYKKVLTSIEENHKLDTVIDLLALAAYCDKWAQLHIKYDFIDNGFSMQELQAIINSRIKKESVENENDSMPSRGHLTLVVSNDSPKGPNNYPSTSREI